MKSGFEFANATTEDSGSTKLKMFHNNQVEQNIQSWMLPDDKVLQSLPAMDSQYASAVRHRMTNDESTSSIPVDQNLSALRAITSSTDDCMVLDGLANEKGLVRVLFRAFLASTVYAISTSVLMAALVQATHITLWGLGPVEMAVLHALSVVFFVTIMIPFSIMLAWIYRYRKPSPYQQRTILIDLPYSDTFQLAVAAGMTVTGSPIGALDYHSGRLSWEVPRSRVFSNPQDLVVRIQKISNDKTSLSINTSPVLNPIQSVLFGYTLTEGGAKSTSIMESFLTFLELNML